MAAAVTGVERGGGGSDDAWSSLQKISNQYHLQFRFSFALLPFYYHPRFKNHKQYVAP